LQTSNHVIIKGIREGLLLILDDGVPFDDIAAELSELLSARPGFFQGAEVTINAGRRIIDQPEFDSIYSLLTGNGIHINAFVSLSAQSRMVAESFGIASRPPSFAAGDAGGSLGLAGRGKPAIGTPPVPALDTTDSVAEAGAGLFLRCNLRAGQSVRFGGDVCVLGNVEAGAEIIADGDVVVWGVLYGIVHAGASGDDEAVVCALDMSPTQLSHVGVAQAEGFPQYERVVVGDGMSAEVERGIVVNGGRVEAVTHIILGDESGILDQNLP